jgi:hypothetical protein
LVHSVQMLSKRSTTKGTYKHYKNATIRMPKGKESVPKGKESVPKGKEIRLSGPLCKGIYKH